MKKDILFSLLLTFSILPYVHLNVQSTQTEGSAPFVAELSIPEPVQVDLAYGFRLDSFQVDRHTVRNGQTLGDLLQDLGVDYPNVLRVVDNCKGVFEYKSMRQGKPYAVVSSTDILTNEKYLVYQPNSFEYYKIALQDSFQVVKQDRPITLKRREASGIIESSLWNALVHNGLSPEMAVEMSEIFAWTVNFFALQDGDNFKLIFDEKWVGDELVGYGHIHAALFHHGGEDFYAIPFEQDGQKGYYSELGKSLEADFLKSPVKYSRISSGYSGNRFHPVQKRWKAHLGTDFAAPTGTPILSTAHGTVVEAKFSQFNGHYVKIKHNETITTQYLHMSKIATGMRPGKAVKQGDVIGYVGSTGLASGPHVCYRFWMNGKQVNSQGVKISASRKIKEENMAQFDSSKETWLNELNNIQGAEKQLYAQEVLEDQGDSKANTSR